MFKGEVEAFDARLNQDARTLMVRGTLANPERKLLPGMFANAAVLAGEPKHLVTVPRTAVTYRLYGDSVWVVKHAAQVPAPAPTSEAEPVGGDRRRCAAHRAQAQGGAALRPRRTTQGDRVAIVEGIKAGDEVVTSGQLKLQPGAAIKVDNAAALKSPADLPKQ